MSDDTSLQELRSATDESYEQLAASMSHIKGWAIDANNKNDPTFPIRQRFKGDGQGFKWTRPAQQKNVEGILQSNERKKLPGVFGTSVPAMGMSGCVRRYAFRFSEGQYRHWLLLLLADRINMVEGLAEDITRGKLPHCLDEGGFKAQLKHNPANVATKAALGVVAVSVVILLLQGRKK